MSNTSVQTDESETCAFASKYRCVFLVSQKADSTHGTFNFGIPRA